MSLQYRAKVSQVKEHLVLVCPFLFCKLADQQFLTTIFNMQRNDTPQHVNLKANKPNAYDLICLSFRKHNNPFVFYWYDTLARSSQVVFITLPGRGNESANIRFDNEKTKHHDWQTAIFLAFGEPDNALVNKYMTFLFCLVVRVLNASFVLSGKWRFEPVPSF